MASTVKSTFIVRISNRETFNVYDKAYQEEIRRFSSRNISDSAAVK